MVNLLVTFVLIILSNHALFLEGTALKPEAKRYLRRNGRMSNRNKPHHGDSVVHNDNGGSKEKTKRHCNSKFTFGCKHKKTKRPCNSKFTFGCSQRHGHDTSKMLRGEFNI
jgi:hypothetical protein